MPDNTDDKRPLTAAEIRDIVRDGRAPDGARADAHPPASAARGTVGHLLAGVIDALVQRHAGLLVVGLLGAGAGSLGTTAIADAPAAAASSGGALEEQHEAMMLILCLLAAEHGAEPRGCEPYRGLRLNGAAGAGADAEQF